VRRDLKCIGMDVHKEAMVIAVPEWQREAGDGIHRGNQSQQFMHGLRGELHVRERLPPGTHESTGSRPVAPVLSGPCSLASQRVTSGLPTIRHLSEI
jgi:hypothetical protein